MDKQRINSPLLVVFPAHTTGLLSGPDWVTFGDARSLLTEVLRLQQIVLKHGLSEARITLCADEWGPASCLEDVALDCDELVVTRGAFWLTAETTDDGSCRYQCVAIYIDPFAAAVEACQEGTLYFPAEQANNLKSMREDEAAESGETDEAPSV